MSISSIGSSGPAYSLSSSEKSISKEKIVSQVVDIIYRNESNQFGFKENEIMSYIISGNTGFERHRRVKMFIDCLQKEDLDFNFEEILEPVL